MIRTIIVDDEILSRIGIQSFIDGKEGIEVTDIFSSAEEALTFLRSNQVDIVITDIEMSEMDGLEFIGHIREEQLADGIIILSCHENFSYAQEAIRQGTDSYMIKQSITEQSLIREIKKVYENCRGRIRKHIGSGRSSMDSKKFRENVVYTICTLRWKRTGNGTKAEQTDQIMFLHLLEGIVEENKYGTVFAPHDKDIFLMLQQDKQISEEKRIEERAAWLTFIHSSIQNYIAEELVFGVSSFYTDVQETKKKHEEAADALNRSFYSEDQDIYYYHRSSRTEPKSFMINNYNMLDPDWMTLFTLELDRYLEYAGRENIRVENLKAFLEHSIQRILIHVLNTYGLPENKQAVQEIFRMNPVLIHQAATIGQLRSTILTQISNIRIHMEQIWNHDDLSEIFRYIEEHLQDRISINDLTELSYMSTSTFCKKFKDRTGMTLIQYLNERRIEKAKIYLSNPGYSLDDVAEMTGFTSTNYLVRVFKKMTNQTVSDYRRKYSITTE